MYPIRDAARAAGRSIPTLRRWERLGLIPPARRDPRTNMRLYTADEVFAIARLAGREDAFDRQTKSAADSPRLLPERSRVE